MSLQLPSRPAAILRRVLPGIAVLGACLPAVAQTPLSAADAFRGFAKQYCLECHNPEERKGRFDMESFLTEDPAANLDRWDEIVGMLELREMPPVDEQDVPRPGDREYDTVAGSLKSMIAPLLASRQAEPGTHPHDDFIEQNCASCHNPEDRKGELVLEGLTLADSTSNPELFERILRRLDARQMPPPNRSRPPEASYQTVVRELATTLDAHAALHPHPGRTDTFRRLNRTEYQNAIRDLLGVEIDAASLLPKDESSHGFDNVTVANLSPTLLDRYITAAQKISRLAVGTPPPGPQVEIIRVPADVTQSKHVEGLPLGTRGGISIEHLFPQDGEYEIRVRLARDRNEHVEGSVGAVHEMDLLLERQLLERFVIQGEKPGLRDHSHVDEHLVFRTRIAAGPRRIGVTFPETDYSVIENKRMPFEAQFNMHRHPRKKPAVYQVSIAGPFDPDGAGSTPSRAKIFTRYPSQQSEELAAATDILSRLMKLAYRRPIENGDLAKPLRFYRDAAEEGGFEAGIEHALASILVSPEFLFRIERSPDSSEQGPIYAISDLELASRLSFMLWSSIPDEELLDHAIAGRLREDAILEGQVRRLMADQRSRSLVNNFASQWLYLRNLDSIIPDLRQFTDFDDNLRQAFREETELFFESILREDRPVTELLSADYTFLNERLARHYGIPHVIGSRFRRVELKPEYHRGGILRHGSVLTVTSYATRTSPTIRGNWILENIIGTPPPPPPPDIPDLEDQQVDFSLPIRERLAQHRADPTCASCHDLIDPIGFVLENYDAVGRWREFEHGLPIDATGGLPDGSQAENIADLEKGLLERPDLFARTLTEKLLTFGLGRGIDPADASAVRQIVLQAAEDDYRFSSLIIALAKSIPFQMRTVEPKQYTSHPDAH